MEKKLGRKRVRRGLTRNASRSDQIFSGTSSSYLASSPFIYLFATSWENIEKSFDDFTVKRARKSRCIVPFSCRLGTLPIDSHPDTILTRKGTR